MTERVDTTRLDDGAFTEHVIGQLDAAARQAREATLREALTARPARSRRWVLPVVALAAAALGVLSTLAISSATQPERPMAFDGGARTERLVETELSRDAKGRLSELRTTLADGAEERLHFRSGRLVRSEQRKDGQLHGPALDFDASGRVVAIRWYAAGQARGPWVVFGADGAIESSGVAP